MIEENLNLEARGAIAPCFPVIKTNTLFVGCGGPPIHRAASEHNSAAVEGFPRHTAAVVEATFAGRCA